jgi:RNA polymerase sigma-70 factor (sigma-E family)
VRNGQPTDFDERFVDLAALALRVAYRIVGNRAAAEDIAQESLARCFVRWRRVHGYADAWVARVAANLALDQARRRPPPLLTPRNHHASDQVSVDRMELIALLRTLPRRQREVIVLRFLADLPERAVAEHLGCSTGTVKQHTHRALASLRRSFSDRSPDSPLGEPAATGACDV